MIDHQAAIEFDPLPVTEERVGLAEARPAPAPRASIAETMEEVAALFRPTGLGEAMPLALLAWLPVGGIVGWNSTAQEVFGWTREEALGRDAIDLIVPADQREEIRSLVSGISSDEPPLTSINENITKSGDIILCEWHNCFLRDEEQPINVSMARDITRQRQAEREKERLSQIAAAANAARNIDEILQLVRTAILEVGRFDRAGVWLTDERGLQGSWGTDINGGLRDERSWRCNSEMFSEALRVVLDAGKPYVVHAQPLFEDLDAGGQAPVDYPLFAAIGLFARGQTVAVVFVDNRITERPVSEEHIQSLLPFCEQIAVSLSNLQLLSEHSRIIAQQHRLMEISAALMGTHSLDDILRQLRDAAVEAGGFDRAGVWLLEGQIIRGSWGTDPEGRLRDEHDETYGLDEGPNVNELMRTDAAFVIQPISSEDIAAFKEALPSTHALVALRAGGETVGFVSVDNLLSDRPLREEELLPLLPFAAQAAIAIRNAQMFEQLKQAQNTLVRSEKMRALGELASGVAHNINNLLTAVLGYSELIQQDPNVSARVSQYARVIERAGLDGAEIVRRVQQFARMDSADDMAAFDLSTVVQEAIDLTRPAWRNQAQARGCEIRLEMEIESRVRAFGLASEIREVVVNLIKNAADAMPSGGTLTVRCRPEGKEALVEVADTGTGMDETVRKRIFEPFFTTKGMGLGTGLGLSLAWGTIARHDGRIEVASKPGEGSRFQVRLPVPKTDAVAEPGPAERRASELAGTRLLLVEDEVIVAESVYRSLTARGAAVEIAESAAEALEWLRKPGSECDVVVSDHGMAGMTGLELLGVVKAEFPGIRRILLSGWGANPPGDVDTSSPELILSKPVRQDVLVHSILTLRSAPGC